VPFNDVSRRYASLESLKVEISTLIECGPYLNGEHTARFQENFAKYIGADYCLGVSSGTVALELALASLQLPKYSKILVAANSGGYGSIAIQKNQLLPCYIDVNENGILDPESILSATI
jgi:dTDP-4-amino-4,6-dideoxygalactose transaminase